MSIDYRPAGESRPAKYDGARFLSCPPAPALSSKRKQVGVRVRGPSVKLILGRESPQTKVTQHHSKPPSP